MHFNLIIIIIKKKRHATGIGKGLRAEADPGIKKENTFKLSTSLIYFFLDRF